MAQKEKRVYHSRKPWKTVLTAFLIFLVVLIALAAAIFFGFRKYIVYTDNGIVLEVPWLPDDDGGQISSSSN